MKSPVGSSILFILECWNTFCLFIDSYICVTIIIRCHATEGHQQGAVISYARSHRDSALSTLCGQLNSRSEMIKGRQVEGGRHGTGRFGTREGKTKG